MGINTLQTEIDALTDHTRPGTVQVVAVNDGEENSSSEYSGKTINKLITEKTQKHNQDAVM